MRNFMVLAALVAFLIPAVALADDPAAPPPPPAASSSSTPAPFVVSGPGASAPSLKGGSVWGILPWGGIGVGARFMVPVAIPPLIHGTSVKDSFAFEGGADFLRWSYGFGAFGNYTVTELVPVAGLMWSIWLNPQLAFYPKVELGYVFYSVSGFDQTWGSRPTYSFLFWDLTGGALYRLNGGITLRAEIGYAGLKLGAGWLF